jgi:hypothetical protein
MSREKRRKIPVYLIESIKGCIIHSSIGAIMLRSQCFSAQAGLWLEMLQTLAKLASPLCPIYKASQHHYLCHIWSHPSALQGFVLLTRLTGCMEGDLLFRVQRERDTSDTTNIIVIKSTETILHTYG